MYLRMLVPERVREKINFFENIPGFFHFFVLISEELFKKTNFSNIAKTANSRYAIYIKLYGGDAYGLNGRHETTK